MGMKERKRFSETLTSPTEPATTLRTEHDNPAPKGARTQRIAEYHPKQKREKHNRPTARATGVYSCIHSATLEQGLQEFCTGLPPHQTAETAENSIVRAARNSEKRHQTRTNKLLHLCANLSEHLR